MPYTRGQMYQICQAIEPAYNRDTMRQMTAHCMTVDFDAHASEKGFSDQLWEFVNWANRKGKALELVRCAATNNPGNDALQALYTAMQTWPVEPVPPTRTPTGPVAPFSGPVIVARWSSRYHPNVRRYYAEQGVNMQYTERDPLDVDAVLALMRAALLP